MAKAEKMTPPLFVVIMAGGKGRRFWPRSRTGRPKQLLPIGTKEPLLRETVDRLLPLLEPTRIFISTSRELMPAAASLVPEIPSVNFILEPEGRDTAAGLGLALEYVSRTAAAENDETVLAMLPADHCIGRPGRFRQALKKAVITAARTRAIVTLGIKPDRPSPAYGYIQPGNPLPGHPGVWQVQRFVEKPDPATAQKYIQKGFLWNAGMFIFRCDVMRAAFRCYLPELAAGLERIGRSMGTPRYPRDLARLFPRLPKISLDFGIMEKADHVAVVPVSIDWSDVGGWDALYCRQAQGPAANVATGPVELVDTTGCYVEAERLVALVGVKDLVVIDCPDAVLVMHRDREADLKKLTDRLEKKGRKDLL
jgi:mannose-1-phosphate guanylyltransferase